MAVTYRYKARASGCRIPAASPPERGSVRKLRWPRQDLSPASSVSLQRPIFPRSSPRRHNRIGYQPGLCTKAEDLLPRPEIQPPGGHRDDDLATHDRALQVGIRVVLAAVVGVLG